MLSWFFKKGVHTQAPVAPKVPPPPAVLGAAAAAAPAAAGPDWAARLQAAQGDDAALLRIAASAPRLEIKMAAVQALAAEASLRQAEREFRSHDRKVHRLAKQRLEAAVAQREARARAQVLLERAAALVDEADVPINHVVELDPGWHALAADLLEPRQLRASPNCARGWTLPFVNAVRPSSACTAGAATSGSSCPRGAKRWLRRRGRARRETLRGWRWTCARCWRHDPRCRPGHGRSRHRTGACAAGREPGRVAAGLAGHAGRRAGRSA
ncbi:MAG: hypothetical protein IPI51_17155 [Betaproteobacteria bacterium]|nr:hypothetical protein [Betaproteobacteria bacterium]